MAFRPRSPFVRGLALFLCGQPVLWVNSVALAQAVEPRGVEPRAVEPRAAEPAPPGQPPPPQFQQQAGEPPRAQDRVPPQAASQPVDEPLDPERYVLGPGDVLELHFWGVENFRLRVAVDLEGRAFVPKVGYLSLQGKTLARAQQMMRESVARFFPRLGFGMTLTEPRTFLVQVVDDVSRPGPQPAKALDRVSTVISRAGGIGPNGSQRRIEIKRRDGTVLRADLLLYSMTGDVKHNPYVLDGDVVRVPFQTLVATIGGGVNRPGSYELVGKADLAELVGLAGGLAPGATRELPITVIRRGPDEKLQRVLFPFEPGGEPPAIPISSEDSVLVPNYTELQKSVTITGAIAGAAAASPAGGSAPGAPRGAATGDEAAGTRRVPYAQGDTVRSILDRVGGPGPLADLKGAYIIRNDQAVPVDLYAVLMLRDMGADRPVELGDTVVLPFKRQSVMVEGAIFKPGPYPYSPNFAVENYLALAGGMNRFAQDVEDVYLVTAEGETRNYSPNLKVEPGASLIVPERNFSRSEVVGIIIAGAGLLVSAATIFVTLRK
jgi:protein involved in polysaccharide export with SLBB domain